MSFQLIYKCKLYLILLCLDFARKLKFTNLKTNKTDQNLQIAKKITSTDVPKYFPSSSFWIGLVSNMGINLRMFCCTQYVFLTYLPSKMKSFKCSHHDCSFLNPYPAVDLLSFLRIHSIQPNLTNLIWHTKQFLFSLDAKWFHLYILKSFNFYPSINCTVCRVRWLIAAEGTNKNMQCDRYGCISIHWQLFNDK